MPGQKPQRSLTLKQKSFIEAYCRLKNGVKAAKEAGYQGEYETLAQVAYENLRKPEIAAAIDQRFREATISADEVLRRLTDQATLDLDDFFDFGPGAPYLNLEKAEKRGKTHLIKEIGYSQTGKLVLKFHDPQAALRDIGKYHKLFTDRVEHDFSKLNDADLVREAAVALSGVVTPGGDPGGDDRPTDLVLAAPPDDEAA